MAEEIARLKAIADEAEAEMASLGIRNVSMRLESINTTGHALDLEMDNANRIEFGEARKRYKEANDAYLDALRKQGMAGHT